MFTTEDQREEMLALKAAKQKNNTGTNKVNSTAVSLTTFPAYVQPAFASEAKALKAKSVEYAGFFTALAEAAIEKERWGRAEDAPAFWQESQRMDTLSRECGEKASFYQKLSYDPSVIIQKPGSAPKPSEPVSPIFKSTRATTMGMPSSSLSSIGSFQNTKIMPISPLTTPQTASAREQKTTAPAASDSTTNTSAPSQDFDAASASAQEAYKAYKEYEKTFQNEYGHRDDPESAYGYHDAYAKLQKLKQNYLEQVDYLLDNASTFEVNLETTSAAADREILQLQLEKTIEEMWAYYNADPEGTDPKAIIWYIEQIAAIKSAMNPRPNTTYQDGPAFKERLVQMGNSATSGIAGSLVQSVATTSEWISQYASIEGDLAERNATLDQLLRDYNSYLDAGIPEDNILVVQLKEAIDNTRAEINYIESGQRSEDRANARQELYLQADEYYDAADAARKSAVEGLGTMGTFLVDMGIEGCKLLADATVGFVAGGPWGALASQLVRSFGNGAYKAATAGGGPDAQMARGLANATFDFIMNKLNVGSEVYDDITKSFARQSASQIQTNMSIREIVGSYTLESFGESLCAMLGMNLDPIYEGLCTGEYDLPTAKEMLDEGLRSFYLTFISNIIGHE